MKTILLTIMIVTAPIQERPQNLSDHQLAAYHTGMNQQLDKLHIRYGLNSRVWSFENAQMRTNIRKAIKQIEEELERRNKHKGEK